MLATGEKVDKTDVKHKPRHLGSFILGAARRLWLKHSLNINPDLTDTFMTYCDTDTVHITGEVHRGLIDDNKLSYLSNDCDDNVPKWYLYNCLTENGENITVQKPKTSLICILLFCFE